MTSTPPARPDAVFVFRPPPPRAAGPDPLRWWALAVIALAQLTVLLDGTIVNIALPSAQAELGMGDGSRQWVITAYSLALGGLLLLGGRVVDLMGRRRAFVVGLLGFSVASAVGGAATTPVMLFAARAGQGAFAALLMPTALSLLVTMFTDPRERGRAFAVFGTVSGVGSAAGLILGGLLTEYLGWRWCMYVNVPIALAAIAGGLRVLRGDGRGPGGTRLDVAGALWGCGGVTAAVYGCSAAEARGWADATVLGALAAAAVLLVVFAVHQGRVRDPLLPLRVVRERMRAGALGIAALGQIGTFAVLLFVTYYLQVVLGYSAVLAGVAFLPLTVGMTGGVTLAARLAPRSPARSLVTPALLVAAAGALLLTRVGTGSSYAAVVLPALVLCGLGLGGAAMTAMTVATAGVAPADSGAASAVFTAAQQVGGSVGTAVLNTVAASVAADRLAGTPTPSPGARAEAAVHGFTVALWAVVALLVAGAAAALLLGAPRRAGHRGGRGPGRGDVARGVFRGLRRPARVRVQGRAVGCGGCLAAADRTDVDSVKDVHRP
ncbi:MFS transporter [Streptomyces sp. 11x1]|uniref:MFS transporter n=1 Tax=Streptomyces sp. 11x1 TaxID=3038642 RepID=UPI0029315479|nr:MFS transporter [Streptomyces sp. 11x1]WNZ06314.1 MFS transporter [Streptomyces sp. 11x1]